MHRLLVVDDEIDVCDFVRNFFEERGFKVFTALNGTEAVSIVQREHPELILLDIKMKGIDGLAALRQIREVDPNCKVIMVTALEEQDKMDEAKACGAIGYITKPLMLEYLEAAVMNNISMTDSNDEIRNRNDI